MTRHEQWSVGERPSLDIGVPVGFIDVRTGDAGIIQLTLESAAAADFEITNTGDRVSVRHPSRWSLRGRNCRLTVTVPAGTDVTVDSASAEVRLTGRYGAVRVRTASGDIQVDRALRLDVTTASGTIACGTVDGDTSLSSVSGDCTLKSVDGRLDVTVTSGDLRVDTCAGDVSMASTSGSARVGHCGGSDISVRSISGDVRLGLPSGIRVEADLSTVSGRAQLPEPAPSGGDRRPVRLMVKTVSGDIRLERSN
ncbi:MAG: DUF4097 family beta strand repeat-containing protein [Actinomycetota bacterium]|nr:DUF4097 family beta strand repeat-containing protein [Actinomycetota bacterium]